VKLDRIIASWYQREPAATAAARVEARRKAAAEMKRRAECFDELLEACYEALSSPVDYDLIRAAIAKAEGRS
jgi:hypothetical protein